MMGGPFIKTSVVILGRNLDATVLHPSFLFWKGIVGSDFELAEPPFSSPKFSTVSFINGYRFQVEMGKAIVENRHPFHSVEESEVAPMALNFLTEIGGTAKITGLGINFTAFFDLEKANSFLIERFLKTGNWNNEDNHPESISLKMKYKLPNSVVNFTIDSAEVAEGEIRRAGVLFDANYHFDIDPENGLAEVTSTIGSYIKQAQHFSKTTRNVLNLGI